MLGADFNGTRDEQQRALAVGRGATGRRRCAASDVVGVCSDGRPVIMISRCATRMLGVSHLRGVIGGG